MTVDSVGNVRTHVYAKFRRAALRIKKALCIFRELITTTTTTTTTTRVAFGDRPSESKKLSPLAITVRDLELHLASRMTDRRCRPL